MPLSAILNNKKIHSFNYTKEQWKELKSSYKNHHMIMSCCDRNAIPKTSKLGTQYFSHARRGHCTSASETKEHLQLKEMAAKAAVEAGYTVTTEHRGYTPEGEEWIADVYCEKNNAKIALEIQWSDQTADEYQRRQKKYADSGVRCAWFSRKRPEEYRESKDIPVFKVDHDFKAQKWRISMRDRDVEFFSFVKMLLTSKIKWRVEPDHTIRTLHEDILVYRHIDCPYCNNECCLPFKVLHKIDDILVSHLTKEMPLALRELSRGHSYILPNRSFVVPIFVKKNGKNLFTKLMCPSCNQDIDGRISMKGSEHSFTLKKSVFNKTEKGRSYWIRQLKTELENSNH